jgi:hypothetical protein
MHQFLVLPMQIGSLEIIIQQYVRLMIKLITHSWWSASSSGHMLGHIAADEMIDP